MKILVLTILIATASFSVSAQTAKRKAAKRPTKKSDVTTIRKFVFPREKFDPLRDAKADLQTAMTNAAATGKRIILDVGGEWCGWCVYMDRFFFENRSLTKLRDESYVWVKVNMDEVNGNKEFLASYPEIKAYPHLFVLDEKGALLHSQDTELLESGKGYNLVAFTAFLKKWAPARN